MDINAILEGARNETEQFRRRIKAPTRRTNIRQAMIGNGGVGTTNMLSHLGTNEAALKLYKAFRDTQYTAIRPIATRFAAQPIRVAVTPRLRGSQQDRRSGRVGPMAKSLDRNARESFTKSLANHGLLRDTPEGPTGASFWRKQKAFRRRMPGYVKQALPTTSVVLDDHEILATLRRPNDYLPSSTLMSLMASSLMTAGKALLVYDKADRTAGSNGRMTPSVYYIPMHWATPNHEGAPFTSFTIQPDNGGQPITVKRNEFVYCSLFDPADPLGAVTPLTAHAKAVNTGDALAQAHLSSLNNLVNPSYAIRAGSILNPDTGRKQPVLLPPDEREKIMDLFKRLSSGVLKNGEPIVLDALIEEVFQLGSKPKELDFLDSCKINDERIMHGVGVSSIITGFAQNANRAGSTVAHGVFYDVVMNPLLGLVGSAFTLYLGPYYSNSEYEVTVYYDAAVADDLEARKARVAIFKDRLSDTEARRFMMTGHLEYAEDERLDGEPEEIDDDSDEDELETDQP